MAPYCCIFKTATATPPRTLHGEKNREEKKSKKQSLNRKKSFVKEKGRQNLQREIGRKDKLHNCHRSTQWYRKQFNVEII